MEIYNTTWWGNAIDTAITAGTEPDFFGSQMKMLTGQPELVTNGDFTTDSDWHNYEGWSIESGVAKCDGNNQKKISQNIGLAASKSYEYIIDVKTLTSGAITLFYYNGSYQTIAQNLGLGTHNLRFSTSGTPNGSIYVNSNSFIGSIDNVSVKLARAEEVEAVKCLADWIHTTALQDLNN